MEFILIDVIRYLITAFLGFSVFYGSKKSTFKHIFLFSTLYAMVSVFFKIFIWDSPVITLMGGFTIFLCLLFVKGFNEGKFLFTYSIFVSSLTECTHILIFELISFVRRLLKMPEIAGGSGTPLATFRVVIAIVYAIALVLIYKLDIVDTKFIQRISKYIVVPISLIIGITIIVYLKYYIKYTDSDKFHNILSHIFVAFTIMFFIVIVCAKTVIKKFDKVQESKTNFAIKEAEACHGLTFSSEKFNLEKEYFLGELEKIGMNRLIYITQIIAFVAVLLYHEENPKATKLSSQVYPIIGKKTDRNATTVEGNISYALKKHWSTRDCVTLSKIEKNYTGLISENNGAPTPKEFFLYLVNKAKKKPNLKIK